MSSLRTLLATILLTTFPAACTREPSSTELTWRFPVEGISTVIVQSATAKVATIHRDPSRRDIEIRARTALLPAGYHSPELAQDLTPSSAWTFDFVPTREDAALRLTSKGETAFPAHHYVLRDLVVSAPEGIEIVCENAPPARP